MPDGPQDANPVTHGGEGLPGRLAQAIEALDAQIARMARALGLQLATAADLAAALRANPASPTNPLPAGTHHQAHSPNIARQQLQALLTLRYTVITRCIDQIGPTATLQLLIDAEAHLLAHGFAPGADGLDLQRLLPAK